MPDSRAFECRITPCRAADLPILVAVAVQSYREHYLHLWTDDGAWYLERCFTPAVLAREMTDPTSHFYLIYRDEAPVGFLKINDQHPLEGYPPQDCLEVERLYLLAAVTGQGVGRKSLAFADGLARDKGRRVVWLKAMDTSPAVHFYEQVGFRTCGHTRLTFPLMKAEFRNMLIMKKDLA
jgi:GNAT superfamily N-acetyltransferase